MVDLITADHRAFVRRHTSLLATWLVPEIELALASEATEIYSAAAELTMAMPPYWAFAWPGGQALARHLIDRPELVMGRRVLDLGSGSAIQAIAAARVGATSVVASDIDPHAACAAEVNARHNRVHLDVTTADLLASEPDVDLVLIGDLVYEPELETRVGGFLQRARQRGLAVLFGDRTTSRRPAGALELLAEYVAPVTPALLDGHIEKARVWRLA